MNDRNRRADDRPRIRFVVYALLLALPVAFVAGRVTEPSRVTVRQAEASPVPRDLPDSIERFHDAVAGVTCWRVMKPVDGYTVSISCLPDAVLEATWVTGGAQSGGAQ